MAERGNLRRWGRIDALVTAAVCLLLVLFVPVLLAKPREHSIRLVCAANLSQIGKTMFVYAADSEGILPQAGNKWGIWGATANWAAPDRIAAFGSHDEGTAGQATISASFYLLVKYYQMPTRLFLCRGDKGTTEFTLSDFSAFLPAGFTLADAWDFGPQGRSFRHCSFSLHLPYNLYQLTTSRDPNLAVAADRNPFLPSPGVEAITPAGFRPDLEPWQGTPEQARVSNSNSHQKDGQNVLFLDGRVTFKRRAYCGIESDNIYLCSTVPERGTPMGVMPVVPWTLPMNRKDSLLVHDPNNFPPVVGPQRR